MEMPTVVTLYVDPAGATRVSRVTAHGEDLLQPEPEVAAICAGLYRRLAGGTPTAPTEASRLVDALREVALSIDQARVAASEPLAHATRLTHALGEIIGRLDRIEKHMTEQLWTAATVKGWIEQVYLRNPIVLKEIRGQ